jgi:tRNA dimethylallyltransferase
VFGELEIGTGKPTRAERAARPHHMFESLSLGQRASAGWYARAAREACEAIRARGRVALLVGGSGLYLRAAMEGLSAEPPHDPAARERLRERLAREGVEALHAALVRVDPATAARLRPRDAQRITRALEVWEASGRPLSWWHTVPGERAMAGPWRVFELVARPARLDAVIAGRTRAMFASGLVEETADLLTSRNVPWSSRSTPSSGRLRPAEPSRRTRLTLGRLRPSFQQARSNAYAMRA